MTRLARLVVLLGLSLPALLAGCAQTQNLLPVTPQRLARGYVCYLDGAGGGGALRNWSGGVKDGLVAAGYRGAAEMYDWETGLGALVDQDAGLAYKRAQAALVAARLENIVQPYPAVPVSLIGLSAGTAVTVFTLEALPDDRSVDNVVLLGASIAANYDLTKALRHVRHQFYVVTSEKDVVLSFLVPMTGTADRQADEAAAGLKGFTLPPDAGEETQRLYRQKIVTIHWTKAFERDHDFGRHLDNVNKEFIRDHVAPLLLGR
jgi:pimeloyl-ACP methyl ester carboxylesterase